MSPRPRTIDIRPLLAQGKEPLAVIRQHLDRLAGPASFVVIAPFIPSPLIELLRGEGFSSAVEHLPDGAWRVQFRRG